MLVLMIWVGVILDFLGFQYELEFELMQLVIPGIMLIGIYIMVNSISKRRKESTFYSKRVKQVIYDLYTNVWAGVMGMFFGLFLGNFDVFNLINGIIITVFLLLLGITFLVPYLKR